MKLDIQADSRQVFQECQSAYHKTLVAPLDDMWAAFADMAEPYALVQSGKVIGCCAVDESHELRHFYLKPQFEDQGEAVFGQILEQLIIVAAYPSTVDPGFLSLSLDAGQGVVAAALMFQHFFEPRGTPLSDLHTATGADHEAAVVFAQGATDAPAAFLRPYFSDRIERGELLLHLEEEKILASGECRVDQRQAGYAHLGLIVGANRRLQGLGKQLMHALVLECQHRNLKPLCSTEPTNLAARKVIQHAGFRARHRVFRVEIDTPSAN